MSEYCTLESSIRLIMNEGRKNAVKEAVKDNEKAKDDSIPSKKDGGDADDDQDTKKTGQETQPDATMPTPSQTQTDKDVKKSTEDAKDGKADKVVLYPKIGESVTYTEANHPHQVGDKIFYHIGTSDHLKRGKVVKVTPTHLHVTRDHYKYHVPIEAVRHNERLGEDYETKQPYVLQTDSKKPKTEALAIQPNLSPSMGQPSSSLPSTTESTSAMHKVGDIVKPKMGPHAGQPHKVIHVFGDGKMNITPHGVHPSKVKYRLGAVGAYPKDLA